MKVRPLGDKIIVLLLNFGPVTSDINPFDWLQQR